jgi:hypothetical protein
MRPALSRPLALALATLVAARPVVGQPPAPQPAGAQPTVGPSVADGRLLARVAALRSGALVAVRDSGGRVEGRVEGTAGDTLLLRPAGRAVARTPLAAVDALWVAGSGTKRGALIGGALGAAALATLGVLFVSGMCDQPGGCSDEYPRVVAVSGAVGGAAGGLLGAGIGSFFRSWRRVYP